MDATSKRASQELLREHVCLDYVNPVIAGDEADYFFSSYGRLVDWGVAAGTVGAAYSSALLESADRLPGRADSALEYARSIRDVLRNACVAFAARESIRKDTLDAFNEAYARASANRRLDVMKGGSLSWVWPSHSDLARVWWPVLPAAADLFLSPELSRLKRCEGCGWLFLDASKNRSRRWCRMKDCGNREKARVHRQQNRPA